MEAKYDLTMLPWATEQLVDLKSLTPVLTALLIVIGSYALYSVSPQAL
jgi:hypothetical protein